MVLRGVGPERVFQLGRLGIHTVGDLLLHAPRRYEDRRKFITIRELELGKSATVFGKIVAAGVKRLRGGTRSVYEFVIEDGSARLHCRWWNLPFLERIFAVALDIYLSGESGPRGCFTVMTAASEAVADPDIRAMVLEGLVELDKAFAACFRLAKEKGELPENADPAVLAQIASATVHTIAIRARARVPRKELEAIVKGALDVMLGSVK